MCFPSSLPLDPLQSHETLSSISCNDSSPSTLPSQRRLSVLSENRGDDLRFGAPGESSVVSALTLKGSESEEVELGLKEESDDGGKGVIEDGLESVDDGKKALVQAGGSGRRGNEVEEDSEASSSCSLVPACNMGNWCRHPNRCHCHSLGRHSRHDTPSSELSSDFNQWRPGPSPCDPDGDWTETGLHMNASTLQPLPPSSPPLVGAGLANMGNTCFLNAVMQCFTHTVPLVRGLHLLCDDGVPTHHNDEEFCVLSAVRDHVFQALATSGEVIFPNDLVDNLNYISSLFQRYQQEDAHEYLQCLLDKIDACWSKCSVNKGMSSQCGSLVNQVFGGCLVSQLHCCECGHRSDTYEPLVDLSLEIEDADGLDGALKSFTKMENIEDEEVKFTCENCKEQVPVKKQLLLDQAPCVAALHLKRFKSDGHFVEKIDKALEYPLELDLKPYTVDAQNENVELKYELYAVVVHVGFSSTSGHYFCYIRSSPDKWFCIDDSKVTRVSEEVALSQQGYILFYARKGTPWPCSLVKASCDYGIWNTSPKSVLDSMDHICSSNPRRGCVYDVNVVESRGVNRLPCQQASDEVCSTSMNGDTGKGASSDPYIRPRHELGDEELVGGNSSSLSGTVKHKQVENITNVGAQGSVPINYSSCKQKHEALCSKELVDGDSTDHSTGPTNSKVEIIMNMDAQCSMKVEDSSTSRHVVCNKEIANGDSNNLLVGPKGEGNIKDEIKGFSGNADSCQSFQSRSPSPDIYSESEKHPDVAHPQPLKKQKIGNTASLGMTRTMHEQDRKKKEAMKSLRRIPPGRRHMLMAAMAGSRNEASTSKHRRRSYF